jgi:glycosyltransferase involved in cell wall biosynthesis
MGHEAVVVSAISQGDSQNEEKISFYEYDGIPIYCLDKNYFPNTRVKDTYYQPEIRGVLKEILLKINPDIVHVTHLINHTAVLLEVTAELNIPTIATLTDFYGFCFNNKLEAANGSLCHGPDTSRTNCLACLLKAQSVHPNMTIFERQASGNYPLSLLTAFFANTLRRVPGLRKGKLAGFVLDITMRPDILAACYSTYKAVIAPTKFLRDAYIANGLKVPVHLSNFGVDIPRLPKPLKEPGSPIKFGFIGQIASHKGTDILIDAFRQLPAGSAELLIYGPKDQDTGYMAKLTEKAAGFQVLFKGTFAKEKLTDVLAELDFLVIPSTWYENSPLVLLNALATHTPVIVSDVEGMTEFVEDGINGYIFDRGSISDLARVLHRIVEEPLKARWMSKSTNYPRTTKMMVEDVVNVYGTVLSK